MTTPEVDRVVDGKRVGMGVRRKGVCAMVTDEAFNIVIMVPGIPKPQPRVRACIRGRHAGVYDPGTADAWKRQVHLHAAKHVPAEPLTGPIYVDIYFFLPRPQRLMRKKDPEGAQYHAEHQCNDRDNLDKPVLDELTKLRMWHDDGQVCTGAPMKFYTRKGGRPGAVIHIKPAPPVDDVMARLADVLRTATRNEA